MVWNDLNRICRLLLVLACISWHVFLSSLASAVDADTFLMQGDQSLATGENEQAIGFYTKGVQLIEQDEDNEISLLTILSLFTNLATALSAQGDNEKAAEAYQNGLLAYKEIISEIVDKDVKEEASNIAAQTSFFLGMVYQDLGQPGDAVDAYVYAHSLDPMHWASLANLGSVLHDDLADHSRALKAYNEAYAILTVPNSQGQEPTDPPPEPKFILSQLQYRIGLCLSHDVTRQCFVQNDGEGDSSEATETPVDCSEQAAHAFSLAVDYDPDNESAKHMLATMTADATMKRASNTYIQTLFDDYAVNFEHSLVQELRYNGYERLRRGFDRAFSKLGYEQAPVMDLVVDAGCGTGLVGEQFRNVSRNLIGVDLSAAILEQAVQKRPGLYNDTRVGDVTDVFREMRNRIDLIIAGDSYIYFGDLVPLFQAMHEGLRPGGYVAFTLENVDAESERSLEETKPDWRWQLTASGRFAHRHAYVKTVSENHSLAVMHYEPLTDFRFERGVGVRGHVFILQKNQQGSDEL